MKYAELVEYIRVFATIKRNFAQKVRESATPFKATLMDGRIDAYADVIAEIERIELMLSAAVVEPQQQIVVTKTGIEEVDIINQERKKHGLKPGTPSELGFDEVNADGKRSH